MRKYTPSFMKRTSSFLKYINRERKKREWIIVNIVLALVFFSSTFLFSGRLQWTLAGVFVVIIGINLIKWLYENSSSTEEWTRKEKLDKKKTLQLKETSKLTRRAFEGMELSQELLEKQIIRNFLRKFKEKKGLSQDEMSNLLEKTDEFREMVDDELISDLVLSKKSSPDNGGIDDQNLRNISSEKYKKRMNELVRRVDEWG